MKEYPKEIIKLAEKLWLNKSLSRYAGKIPEKNKNNYYIIITATLFLTHKSKFRERLYYIINDLHLIPLCKECGINHVNWNRINFRDFCSSKCTNLNKEIREKQKQKRLKLYNNENYINIEKRIETKIKIYHQRFIDICNKQYENQYAYPELKNSHDEISIWCKDHGEFKTIMYYHMSCWSECLKCKPPSNMTTKKFLESVKKIHNNYYSYELIHDFEKHCIIKIICPIHGIFEQNTGIHLGGSGCQKCKNTGYSKISIKWLNLFNLDIQHIGNIGEYKIPETIINNNNRTGIKVDGYHKETNTVYEFLGDCWHGNPEIYKPDDKPHPFNDKTALELNQEWIDRKQLLKDLDYNVEYIWENDWNKK